MAFLPEPVLLGGELHGVGLTSSFLAPAFQVNCFSLLMDLLKVVFICDHHFIAYWIYIPLCKENIKVLVTLFSCIFIPVCAAAVRPIVCVICVTTQKAKGTTLASWRLLNLLIIHKRFHSKIKMAN